MRMRHQMGICKKNKTNLEKVTGMCTCNFISVYMITQWVNQLQTVAKVERSHGTFKLEHSQRNACTSWSRGPVERSAGPRAYANWNVLLRLERAPSGPWSHLSTFHFALSFPEHSWCSVVAMSWHVLDQGANISPFPGLNRKYNQAWRQKFVKGGAGKKFSHNYFAIGERFLNICIITKMLYNILNKIQAWGGLALPRPHRSPRPARHVPDETYRCFYL